MNTKITDFKIDDLREFFPDQLFLEFSEINKQKFWAIAQNNYSYKVARWNAYLNLLSLNCLITYLQEESNFNNQNLKICFNDLLNNSQEIASSLWEFINGSAIELGKFRLILIPNSNIQTEEICIPQEWVDLRELAGDYYLAIQVNLEQKYVRIWGYTTHQNIKENGEYDDWERNYLLEKDDLIEDITVLWVAQKLNQREKGEIKKTKSLPVSIRENLVKELGKPTPYSPRLNIDFFQWGSLLVNSYDRRQLCLNRRWKMEDYLVDLTFSVTKDIDHILKSIKTSLEHICDSVEAIFEDDFSGMIPNFKNGQGIIAYEGIKEFSIVLAEGVQSLKMTQILEPVNDSGLINILIDITSTSDYVSLPPALALKVQSLNENNDVIGFLQTGENDSNLRLEFSHQFDQSFCVKLLLSDEEIQCYEYKLSENRYNS